MARGISLRAMPRSFLKDKLRGMDSGAHLIQLQRVLQKTGKETNLVGFADGTRILVLPHGGRVLGLFAPESKENFLWTHAALQSVAAARKLFTEMRWPNPGGDRTWLAPVPELFISDMRRIWETYREPAALDPGRYRCETRQGALCLVNRAKLKLYRTGGTATVETVKTFLPAPNPLRYERDLKARVHYAGYTTSVSLRWISDPEKARAQIGLWPIMQLPPGGEMLLPTYDRARPVTIFGKIPASDLKISNGMVRYHMRSPSTAKLAVRAVSTAGRVGYIHESDASQWNLIIRNFFVNPSGEYVDPPFQDLTDLGYAFQACNVAEDSIGHFSEIEHHVPATGYDLNSSSSTDVSQVWAFRGSRKSIQDIARLLLGTPSF